MKNQEGIKIEVSKRIQQAIKNGKFETETETFSRLIHSLQKQWIGYNGKLWTLRQYLIKYDKNEYKRILNAIKTYYKGASMFNRKGDTLDMFNFFHYRNNGIQHDYTSYDGRLPNSQYVKL